MNMNEIIAKSFKEYEDDLYTVSELRLRKLDYQGYSDFINRMDCHAETIKGLIKALYMYDMLNEDGEFEKYFDMIDDLKWRYIDRK